MRTRLLVGLGTVAVAALSLGACVFPPRVVDEAKVGEAPIFYDGPASAGSINQLRPVVIRGTIATTSTADWSDYWSLEGPTDPFRVRITCTQSPSTAGLISRIFIPSTDGDFDPPISDQTPCDGTSVIAGPVTGGTFRPHVQIVGAGAGGSYEVTLEILPAS